MAVTHGVFAKLTVEPRAAEIADEILDLLELQLAGATSPADEAVVRLLSISLAQVEAAATWVAEKGLVDGAGQPQPILRYLSTMINTGGRLADRLGMTPSSRAQLGLDLARTGNELSNYLEQRHRDVET